MRFLERPDAHDRADSGLLLVGTGLGRDRHRTLDLDVQRSAGGNERELRGEHPDLDRDAGSGNGGDDQPRPRRSVVNHNATTSFTITPDPGYRILSATGCNGSRSGSTYTTGPVTADCAVSVLFVDPGTMTAPGNALDFDGLDDVVTVPDDDAFDLTTSYTIEASIKPRAFTWLAGIVSKYHPADLDGYILRLGGSGSYDGIGFDGMETAGGVLQLDVWQHVAAVNNNGTRRLYVNGVEQPLSGTPITTAANNGPVTIGLDYDNRYFNGAIDEVRIWNKARTQGEILATMGVTVEAAAAGLVAYYRFDQGAAGGDNTGVNVLYDRTTNGLDGTLSGFSLSGSSSNWISSGAMPPTGDLTANGVVDVTDALKALRIALGLDAATPADLTRGDVAPLVSGKPQRDGKIDIGDVVVILRKSVGLINW